MLLELRDNIAQYLAEREGRQFKTVAGIPLRYFVQADYIVEVLLRNCVNRMFSLHLTEMSMEDGDGEEEASFKDMEGGRSEYVFESLSDADNQAELEDIVHKYGAKAVKKYIKVHGKVLREEGTDKAKRDRTSRGGKRSKDKGRRGAKDTRRRVTRRLSKATRVYKPYQGKLGK